MTWTRLSVTCPPAAVEAVVGLMLEVAPSGPSIEDSGDLKLVRAYVPAGDGVAALGELRAGLLRIPTYLTGGEPLQVVPDTVADEDWASAWKDFYHPLRIGRRLVVKPSWEPWPPEDDPQVARPDDILIELDPEMAFGTGSHPSTQLCLCVLEDLVRPGDEVLDVGCGSGILSLAAARLGAARVLAIDNDPVAVETATANVARCGLGEAVEVRLVEAREGLPHGPYRVIVANINLPVGCLLAEAALEELIAGGYYVTGGVIESAAETMRTALLRVGLHVVDMRTQEGWVCAIGRKPEGTATPGAQP